MCCEPSRSISLLKYSLDVMCVNIDLKKYQGCTLRRYADFVSHAPPQYFIVFNY